MKISLLLLVRSWQTWAYFKAENLPCRTRESTGTRESKQGESTSPKSWTRGPASLGLAGTRGLASPTGEVLGFKISPSLPRSDQ